MAGRAEGVVNAEALRDKVGDWKKFLNEGLEKADLERLGGHENTGRPAGSETFIEELETRLARSFKKQKPGPKPRVK